MSLSNIKITKNPDGEKACLWAGKNVMNRIEFRNEILKLAPTSYEGDFREHLSSVLDKYLELVRGYNDPEICNDWDTLCTAISKMSDGIQNAVRAIYQGRHFQAYLEISPLIGAIYNKYGASAITHQNGDLYRMRVFDDKSREKPTREGMFHIPFDKRGIVKTERYSAPGYPCLYLGITSYVCWEEMNRPNLNKCFVSRFHTNKKVSMLNLTLPSDKYWDDNKYMSNFLIRFPFIIASMVEVKNEDDTFKPEYIIPQLLMEWVIEQMNSSKEEKTPVGIHYTSVHVNDGFDYPVFFFANYALPAQSPFDGKHSKELCELFSVSIPTSDELERARGTYNDAENIFVSRNNASEIEKKAHAYHCSPFGVMERQLKNHEEDYPLATIDYKQG